MFEGALQYLGLQYSRLQFRKKEDQQLSFTDFFHQAHSLLIVLPPVYDIADLASEALFDALKAFPHPVRLTLVQSDAWSTSLSQMHRAHIVRFRQNDLTRLLLPRKEIIEQIRQTPSYDLAIDLNLDFILYTAYICRVSRAAVRVGCESRHADTFFNVHMKLNRRRPIREQYEQVASLLTMF